MATPSPLAASSLNILDLPTELLQSIASHLAKNDAGALARSCKGLREAAESVVWRTLSLTDRDLLQIPSTLLPPESITWPDGPTSSSLAELPTILPSASWATLGQTVLTILGAQPWRPSQVRKLIIDLRHEIAPKIIDLLTITTGLEHLELHSPGPSFVIAHYSLSATLDLFRSLPNPLLSLKYLRLDIRYRWNETLVEVVSAAPNLQTLHILSHPRRIRGGVPPIPSKLIPGGILPNLRELIVDEMEESFVPTLLPLIKAANHLEAVALRDHAHRWKPTPNCPLILAMATKSKLKRLECTFFLFPFFSLPDAFESLERLSMLWSTDLNFSPRKPKMIIPPLPNLREYQLDISLHASSSDIDLHRHMLILPQIAHEILTLSSIHLLQSPNLTSMYLPPHLEYTSRENVICPPHPNPNSGGYTGMIVHSFLTPSVPHGIIDKNKGRQIIHTRTKVTGEYPLLNRPEGWAEPYDDGQGIHWEEKVFIESGKELPLRVLAAMYAAAGIRLADLPLTREHVLPDVCWNILRCWEMQQEGE